MGCLCCSRCSSLQVAPGACAPCNQLHVHVVVLPPIIQPPPSIPLQTERLLLLLQIVEQEIAAYQQWYGPMDGIFVDEVSVQGELHSGATVCLPTYCRCWTSITLSQVNTRHCCLPRIERTPVEHTP